MSSISAFQSGVNGVQSGLNSLNNNAQKIANSVADNGKNITEAAVGMMQDKQQVQASAKVIETSNEMIGSLLDIRV